MFAQQQAALFKTLPVALLAVDSDNAKALLRVIVGDAHPIALFQHVLETCQYIQGQATCMQPAAVGACESHFVTCMCSVLAMAAAARPGSAHGADADKAGSAHEKVLHLFSYLVAQCQNRCRLDQVGLCDDCGTKLTYDWRAMPCPGAGQLHLVWRGRWRH